MPTPTTTELPLDTIACPSELTGLAAAIQRRLYGPHLEGLMGCRPLVPPPAAALPLWAPCGRCGAIRDELGRVLWARVVYPRTGLRVTRPTGIQQGDHLACVECQCVDPDVERQRGRRGRPIQQNGRDESRPAAAARLSARDRKAVLRKPGGPTWLAMIDAEAAGDVERAGKLQTLLYRLDDGEIAPADLERLTDEVLAAGAA